MERSSLRNSSSSGQRERISNSSSVESRIQAVIDELATENGVIVNNKCVCKIDENEINLVNWELFKYRAHYSCSIVPTKPSSTATLRKLLTGNKSKSQDSRRPTALERYISKLKKPTPDPNFKDDACLQRTLEFEERTKKYRLADVPDPFESDCLGLRLNKNDKIELRTNPFQANQLCPEVCEQLKQKINKVRNVKRANYLLDPRTL